QALLTSPPQDSQMALHAGPCRPQFALEARAIAINIKEKLLQRRWWRELGQIPNRNSWNALRLDPGGSQLSLHPSPTINALIEIHHIRLIPHALLPRSVPHQTGYSLHAAKALAP